jgi:hypothetical protein
MPRKKAKEANALQYRVWARVNERRFKALTELLSKSRHSNMSELVRDLLESRPVKIIVHDDSFDQYMKAFSAIKKELNAIGVNINQLTKQFHSSPTDTQKALTALRISEQYKAVDSNVNALNSIISELSKKWLQK